MTASMPKPPRKTVWPSLISTSLEKLCPMPATSFEIGAAMAAAVGWSGIFPRASIDRVVDWSRYGGKP